MRKPWAIVVPKGPVAARFGVDVDPLVVAGRLGEAVDAVLVDLEPVAGAEVGAGRGGDLVEAW